MPGLVWEYDGGSIVYAVSERTGRRYELRWSAEAQRYMGSVSSLSTDGVPGPVELPLYAEERYPGREGGHTWDVLAACMHDVQKYEDAAVDAEKREKPRWRYALRWWLSKLKKY